MRNAMLYYKQISNPIFLMIFRQGIIQLLNIFMTIFMARSLNVSEYGYYVAILFTLSLCVIFSGSYLVSGIIKTDSKFDYRSFASFNHLIVISIAALVAIMLTISFLIFRFDERILFIIIIGILSIYIGSFQAVPTALMEKSIQFSNIAIIEILQALVFAATAILLVINKLEIYLPLSLLIRSILGALVSQFIYPSLPRISRLDRKLWGLFYFGIRNQSSQLISISKDSLMPIIIGSRFGSSMYGQMSWAQTAATYPAMFMAILQRYYFPIFSSMNDEHDKSHNFREILWLNNIIIAPISLILLVFSKSIVLNIFGDQWLASMNAFYIFWVANLFIASSVPCMSYLMASGRDELQIKFAVLWAILSWVVGLILIQYMGPIGFAITNLVIQLTNIFLFLIVRGKIRGNFFRTIGSAWLTAVPLLAFAVILNFCFSSLELVPLLLILFILLITHVIFITFTCRTRIRKVLNLLRGKQ
ncbi:oligosaccharide flippase family protein [Deinococcus radiotolerans]|uniref:oligosaccharide flippase family protein n=1 Tax=Deinococcus radiotolerans TaxID=1309407 RepID=UPI0016644575|nr:oligosaccharide flippase family protein [Deinococcus radiotolerans]